MTAPRRAEAAPDATVVPDLAFAYREHVQFLWRTCRYLGVSEADAEDVVHEVFMVVDRRLASFDPSRTLRSWLAGIARNVVMHHHRRRARAVRKIDAAPVEVQPAPSPEDVVSQHQAAALLEAFLANLDDDKRDVFVLCDLEGLSAPEVASVLEINVNTVYSRLRVVRQAFERHTARIDVVRRREGG